MLPERAPPRRRHASYRLIRKLGLREFGGLRDHLLRLDPHARAMRFMGIVTDAHIEHYCQAVDPLRRLVLGYFVGGVLRGAGELIFDVTPSWCGGAELALSIEAPWQNRGLGRELLRRLLVLARNRGALPVRLSCLRENRRMISLARRAGVRLVYHRGDVEGTFTMRPPDQLSLLAETWNDGHAAYHLALTLGPAPVAPHVTR